MSYNPPPIMILAGGLGTRLGEICNQKPKAMIEVAGEPFIAHQLRLLNEQGIEHVILCLSHLCEQISCFVGDGSKFGLHVDYSYDGDSKLGTGGAVKKAAQFVDDSFGVLYGDTFLDVDFAPIFEAFIASGRLGLMTVLKNDNRWDKSNVRFAENIVITYDKTTRTDEMHHIDFGLTFLSRTVLENIADVEFDMTVILQHLIANHELSGFEVSKRFYEIGTLIGLKQTNQYLLNRKKHFSAKQ